MSHVHQSQLVFLAHFDWDTSFMQFHKEWLRAMVGRYWDVLWVSGPVQLRQQPRNWVRTLGRGSLQHDGLIWHYKPWTIPGLRFRSWFPLPHRIMGFQIEQVMKRLRFVEPIIVVCTPDERPFLRLLPHSATAYLVGDECLLPVKTNYCGRSRTS